jgi:hypothetical protein
MKKTKSGIIVPDEGVVVPGKKKVDTISTMIQIPFVFNTGQKMDEVIEKLDEAITNERKTAIGAIGKLLGVKVNWED